MYLPLLPEAVEFVLAEHHQWTEVVDVPAREAKVDEAGTVLEAAVPAVTHPEKGAPLPNAPTWRFRPLNLREEAAWRGKLEAAEKEGAAVRNGLAIDLFTERLLGAAPVQVQGPEGTLVPFEPAKHLATVQLPFDWVNELAGQLLFAARLAPDDLGKSA